MIRPCRHRWIGIFFGTAMFAVLGAGTSAAPTSPPASPAVNSESYEAQVHAMQRRGQPLVIPKVPKEEQICFALYTVQNGILKLTAQLYPLEPADPREVRLEVLRDGAWSEIARTRVRENSYANGPFKTDGTDDLSWTAPFRIENWDATRDVPYRVRHGEHAVFEGLVRRDPVDKKEIVVAAFTGNGNNDRRLKPDVIANIKAQDPDLLFFSGDQSYDHVDHLYAWLLFGTQFRDVIRDRPTIAIPDDHDIGQGNVWGASGKRASTPAGPDGGYFMPVDYVNEVQFAQTSHLPDPYDSDPVQRGIGVYYTALNVGRVSFAVVEDRKFKTGPEGLVPQRGPRPDHVNEPGYDPKSVDVPGAELLGDRQLAFLEAWGRDWRGSDMKSVLSQTIFAGVPHIHRGDRLIADLDSNGWPQTGRNRAVEAMRKAFAFHIGGDQHLGCVVQYGVDAWGDAPWAFCVPSIVNYYPRRWDPLEAPARAIETALPRTGDYHDGFGNKYSIVAYVNPDPALANKWGGEWGERAEGYGLVRFNIPRRTITLECWPRGVDVTAADAEQYPGWPVTVGQLENYGRAAGAWLPTLAIRGTENPVVQVIDEATGEIIYTLRIAGTEFRPKVFKGGKYTIKIDDPDSGRVKTLTGLEPLTEGQSHSVEVEFGDVP